METLLAVHDLAPDHVVLELHEHLTAPGPALELHLVVPSDGGGVIAWWADEEGTWLGAPEVGQA